jgi:hypothetical protein
MKDANCGYCMRGELLDKFGIFICDLKVSELVDVIEKSDIELVKKTVREIVILLNDRNKKCKLLK